MDQQLDRHRVALVRHAVGTAGRGTGPQFKRAPVKRACPHATFRCGREPGPDARAFLVLWVGISDAAPFDPRGPERFGSECAQELTESSRPFWTRQGLTGRSGNPARGAAAAAWLRQAATKDATIVVGAAGWGPLVWEP